VKLSKFFGSKIINVSLTSFVFSQVSLQVKIEVYYINMTHSVHIASEVYMLWWSRLSMDTGGKISCSPMPYIFINLTLSIITSGYAILHTYSLTHIQTFAHMCTQHTRAHSCSTHTHEHTYVAHTHTHTA